MNVTPPSSRLLTPGPQVYPSTLGFSSLLVIRRVQRRSRGPIGNRVPYVRRCSFTRETNEFSAPRREGHGMDNASDADLKQLVEDPEDAPLVESADDELAGGDKPAPPDETP